MLVLKKLDFPKTHDLIKLLEIALKKEPLLEIYRLDLRILNPFSVQFRYPGEGATLEDAKQAIKAMRRARKFFIERYTL
jgi:HEPN domain-containing protein